MIDLTQLLNLEFDYKSSPSIEPPQYPVTILDMERAIDCYDMDLPMADPCPNCGAINMKVGDYACWGICYGCAADFEYTK